jgi:hypothetical protein
MNPEQQLRLSKVIARFSALYPEWRIGQMVANVALLAKGPTAEAIWDVEDEEFLTAAEAHLARREAEVGSAARNSDAVSHLG